MMHQLCNKLHLLCSLGLCVNSFNINLKDWDWHFQFPLFLIFDYLILWHHTNIKEQFPWLIKSKIGESINWMVGLRGCIHVLLHACWGHRLHKVNREHLWWAFPWVIPSCRNSLMRTRKGIGKETPLFDICIIPISTTTSQNSLITSLSLCCFVVWPGWCKRMHAISSFFVIFKQFVYRCTPTFEWSKYLFPPLYSHIQPPP